MTGFIFRSSWSWLDKLMFYFGAITLLVFVFSEKIGEIEGALAPVVTGFELTEQTPVNPAMVDVEGRFVIQRPNCDFVQLLWVLVGDVRNVPIDITFTEGAQERKGGVNTFGPWSVAIAPEKLSNTKAAAIHKCPYRSWKTITHLYP